MDADLLVKVQETMERADDGPERNALLTYIHALCDESLISTKPKAINGHLILSPHVWRQRVRDAVQAIISPDVLSWMDDDDASSESHICQRSLYEIKFRFYKSVMLSSLQHPTNVLTDGPSTALPSPESHSLKKWRACHVCLRFATRLLA